MELLGPNIISTLVAFSVPGIKIYSLSKIMAFSGSMFPPASVADPQAVVVVPLVMKLTRFAILILEHAAPSQTHKFAPVVPAGSCIRKMSSPDEETVRSPVLAAT